MASVEALLQRVPPASILKTAFRRLRKGETLERSALKAFAVSTGDVCDDRIDEPGQLARS